MNFLTIACVILSLSFGLEARKYKSKFIAIYIFILDQLFWRKKIEYRFLKNLITPFVCQTIFGIIVCRVSKNKIPFVFLLKPKFCLLYTSVGNQTICILERDCCNCCDFILFANSNSNKFVNIKMIHTVLV